MQSLERNFLEKSGILNNVNSTLKDINFPEDRDRHQLIEMQMERLLSQFFEPKHLLSLTAFFDSEAGKLWLTTEVTLLKEIEKLLTAHISYAKGDFLLAELGLNDDIKDDEVDLLDSLKN